MVKMLPTRKYEPQEQIKKWDNSNQQNITVDREEGLESHTLLCEEFKSKWSVLKLWAQQQPWKANCLKILKKDIRG